MNSRPLPAQVKIFRGRALSGQVAVPGDKSISHRAVLLSSLCREPVAISGLSDGDDVRHTLAAVEALGAQVVDDGDTIWVGGGPDGLHSPPDVIDCGNSGTGLRLLAGMVAGLGLAVTLSGDSSLSDRPMERIARPLRLMGVSIEGHGPDTKPPLTLSGRAADPINYVPDVPSAQVKGAVLLAALGADGPSTVTEAVLTRTHTEEMLVDFGARIEVSYAKGGRSVTVWPSDLAARTCVVPGDPSQAAFWLVAAAVVPGSQLEVAPVYLGPGRDGFVGVLERMGLDVQRARAGTTSALTVHHRPLVSTTVSAAEIPGLIDEVPILAVAALYASGVTRFEAVGELRVKESDRFAAIIRLAESFGGRAWADSDDLCIEGGPLIQGRFDAGGDHRMAMAAAVAALGAHGEPAWIEGFGLVGTSYPGFLLTLDAVAGPGSWRGPVIAIDGPAGAGKSTVARELSARLGIERLDTGALYRALTIAALSAQVDVADEEAVVALAATIAIDVGEKVLVNGTDVTEELRNPTVASAVSVLAAHPRVRQDLVARQRQWLAERGCGVMEGRDIGTVVLPDADVKIFLDASEQARARRRQEETAAQLRRRDALDSSRAASPLTAAADAVVIDTTTTSVHSVVERIVECL